MSPLVIGNHIRNIKVTCFIAGMFSMIAVMSFDTLWWLSLCYVGFGILAYRSAYRSTVKILRAANEK